jgi:hypothetical protein
MKEMCFFFCHSSAAIKSLIPPNFSNFCKVKEMLLSSYSKGGSGDDAAM